ncbi:PAS domain S-box-containing protein [Granulicella rosea]|uniref:histidine kinase n=1 Tax=Granulicella rosea TaxID=474952 RepID=A0A239EDI6_9BACT|nr:PAS domain S-box-containing protein [Granulicella rosea]
MDALESLPNGFVVLSGDGAILYANRAFRALVGTKESPLSGTRFQDYLTRGGVIFYDTQFAPSLQLRGSLEEISFDILSFDRSPVPILVNASVHRSSDANATRLHLSIFVAKQRRRYEAELLRTRREFEEIAEIVRRSTDAILRLDVAGSILSWNHGAQQVFGISSEQAKTRIFSSLFAESELTVIVSAVESLGRGEEVSLESSVLHQSGKVVDVSVRLTPHIEAPGRFVGFSAIIRDTTANKRAERALLQSEKLASVGKLASSIAHEINNPLESVTNLLYILESYVHDPEGKKFVMTAQEELARVSHIATHTLPFHKQSSNRSLVDLQKMAESVLSLYRGRLLAASVRVLAQCGDTDPLFCYEGELRQVMVNLVSNAYDALRSGGTLILRAHTSRNWRTGRRGIRILVADSGSGIGADILAHIFEPFFTTKGIGGTGLGLWITKDLVAKNGGIISARSSDRGEQTGTVLNLFFEDPIISQDDAP